MWCGLSVSACVVRFRVLVLLLWSAFGSSSALMCLHLLVRSSYSVYLMCVGLKLVLPAFLSSVCVSFVHVSPFSVSLRLAFPVVPILPRVVVPGVGALLMLWSPVPAIGSSYSVGAVGGYCFAIFG